jgi:hypothetical protein
MITWEDFQQRLKDSADSATDEYELDFQIRVICREAQMPCRMGRGVVKQYQASKREFNPIDRQESSI